jgi:hypothetical protein
MSWPCDETDESLLDRLSGLAAILDPVPEHQARRVRVAYLSYRAERVNGDSVRGLGFWSPAGRDVTVPDALGRR